MVRERRGNLVPAPKRRRLDAERLPAATLVLGVGVVDFEALSHQTVVEVQFRPREVERALHVDEDLDAVLDFSDTVVVGHDSPEICDALVRHRDGIGRLVDLTGVSRGSFADYHGVAW